MPRISEALDLDEKRGKNGWKSQRTWHLIQRGTIREIQENPTLWKEVDVKLRICFRKKCWTKRFIMMKVSVANGLSIFREM